MIKAKLQYCLVGLGLALFMLGCSEPCLFERDTTSFKIGDQPEWAAPEWNDQDWVGKIEVADGRVFWSRTEIDLLKAPKPLNPYGIRPYVYGEYEVYWDGILIGKNGNPGQEKEIGPEGEMWAAFMIPSELATQGKHLLAIRTSVYHFPDHTGSFKIDLNDYDQLLTDQIVQTSYMHIFAGVFLITSIYFLFLYLNNKKEYPMLVFGICCLLFFVLNLIESMIFYMPIHYSLHHVRLDIIIFLTLGYSFLIPLYFSMYFPYPKRKLTLIIFACILIAVFFTRHEFFSFALRGMALSMWVFSFGIVLYGAYQKIKGAHLVLLTLILSLLLHWVVSFDTTIFTGFSLTLLGMLYLLAISIKDQRLAYEESLVQSSRLRLELLKKNIQPHFLMNTLTSLIDWVEEAPKKGVLFIEALAKEFDLFNQMENQTLVPIEQEISLCRAHLEIMSYRKEIKYVWEEVGIEPDQQIPPAILHTLLENGITHNLPIADNGIKFKLIFESFDIHSSYTFLTFGSNVRSIKEAVKEGTGLKYIKARLTESYGSKWEFTSLPANHGWVNTIKIYF